MTQARPWAHGSGRVLAILALSALGLSLYGLGLDAGHHTRVWVFDGLCPAEAKHVWPLEWCEAVWWHPFRLATRLWPAFGVGAVLFLLLDHGRRFTQLTVSQWRAALLFWLACHVLWIHTLSPAMVSGMIQRACLHGRYSADLSWGACQRQLGVFGDQRLYYPLTVGITVAYLTRYARRRRHGETVSQAAATPPRNPRHEPD